MADQYFNGAVHENIADSSNRSRLDTSLSEMASQMDSYSSTYTYGSYGPGTHGWDAHPKKSNASSEREYLEFFAQRVAEAHRNDQIVAVDGDAWIIIDAFEDYGYGRAIGSVSVDLTGDGNKDSKLYVARALSMDDSMWSDPVRCTTSFTIHELGHLFGPEHWHGEYGYGSSGNVKDISPMATAYVRDDSSNEYPDTCYGGTGKQVDDETFCDGASNYVGAYCGLCTDFCRHDFPMSSCTKNLIEQATPL